MLLNTLKDVVTVPVRAVQRGAPGNYVYLVGDGDTSPYIAMTLGAQDGDFFAVTAGLSPGDRVVTDGADRLRDGAKVQHSRHRRGHARGGEAQGAGAARERAPTAGRGARADDRSGKRTSTAIGSITSARSRHNHRRGRRR